tara:strand:- start:6685 stop:7803 length:1119 start_codon:yes stop_codon:yes gene_type:complete
MKIIFAIKTMLVSGGAERVLSEVASHLINLDYEVSVLSFDKKKELSFYKLDKNIAELKIGDNLYSKLYSKNILPFQFVKKILSLRKEIKYSKPDVVIGFNYSMYFLLAISLIGLNVNLICSEHSSYESFKKKPIALFFLKILSFFKVRFFLVSHFAYNTFPKNIKKKSQVIENPISSDFKFDLNTPQKSNLILSIGRLSSEKNHLELIDSFSQVSGKYPSWKLKIIGNGPLKKEIESLIIEKRLQKKVLLEPETKEIQKEYFKAKFFVLSSNYEGFGLVVAESLSCGLPVILYEKCNVLGFVKNMENGITIKNSSLNQVNLTDAIERLMSDKTLLLDMSQKSRMPVGYDMSSIIQKWDRALKNYFSEQKDNY